MAFQRPPFQYFDFFDWFSLPRVGRSLCYCLKPVLWNEALWCWIKYFVARPTRCYSCIWGELVCFINFCQVGVLYVGPGQENDEKAIFSNQFGSIRYRWGHIPNEIECLNGSEYLQVANNYIFLCSKFLSGLGSLVDTTTTDPGRVYMGGLDPNKDGQFAYIWQDDAMQVKPGHRF